MFYTRCNHQAGRFIARIGETTVNIDQSRECFRVSPLAHARSHAIPSAAGMFLPFNLFRHLLPSVDDSGWEKKPLLSGG